MFEQMLPVRHKKNTMLVAVGVRHRVTMLYSGGSPPLDVVNSLQAGVTLGWDRITRRGTR
jgi:hypothetical protein